MASNSPRERPLGIDPAAAPPYRDALAAAMAVVTPLPAQRVRLDHAVDRLLREPIVADRDMPPFDRATMDGYAVRHADVRCGVPMPVVAKIPAGAWHDGAIAPGGAASIATGAPVPARLDTVIEHERSDAPGRGDGTVLFRSVPSLGASIHRRASDAHAGQTLVSPGVPLRPNLMALAAAVGLSTIEVGPRPRVAILTSGDEIVSVESVPRPHQVRDSNGIMLASLSLAFGADVVARRHLGDDPAAAIAALREAMAQSDVVVTVGGISAGERDPFVTALATLVAEGLADVRVRKAALQPGGPITIARLGARLGAGDAPSAILVALPGNPLSALVCAHLFLWPIVARLSGAAASTTGGPWRRMVLAAPAKPNPRRAAFRPAAMVEGDGASRIALLAWSGSGDLAAARSSDGIVELPVQEELVAAETIVPFLSWAWSQSTPSGGAPGPAAPQFNAPLSSAPLSGGTP